MPDNSRYLALDGILHYSCFPQLSFLSSALDTLTKVNFLAILPNEMSFRILNYLDATSLCRASQVCKTWMGVCDNDVIWKRMCSQHINKKCAKCGWGLPLMPQKRDAGNNDLGSNKRIKFVAESGSNTPISDPSNIPSASNQILSSVPNNSNGVINFQPLEPLPRAPKTPVVTRPWKQIYAERSVVARNWKKSRFSSKDLLGHTDSVMSVFYDEQRSLLISASFDCTLRAWNTDTGVCIGILKGHTRCVRGVQFDDSKIVSCSMDKTIRIWNRKTFECVRVIAGKLFCEFRIFFSYYPFWSCILIIGHTEGLVSIHFIDKVLASGSVDGIIRVWNLEAGTSFTLAGHRDWANKIRILPGKTQLLSCSDDNTMVFLFD